MDYKRTWASWWCCLVELQESDRVRLGHKSEFVIDNETSNPADCSSIQHAETGTVVVDSNRHGELTLTRKWTSEHG